jgi:hypothetical protein
MDSTDKHLHDDLLDWAIIGASHMANGITDFRNWSKAILADEGSESVRAFLSVIFENAKKILERTETILTPSNNGRPNTRTQRSQDSLSLKRHHQWDAPNMIGVYASDIVSEVAAIYVELNDQSVLVKTCSSLPCSWFAVRECFMTAYKAEHLQLSETIRNSYHHVYRELAFFVNDGLWNDFNASLAVAVKCRSERLRKMGVPEDEAFCRRMIASPTVTIEDRKAIWERLRREETCPRDDLLRLADTLTYCGEMYRALSDEWAAYANFIANRKSAKE